MLLRFKSASIKKLIRIQVLLNQESLMSINANQYSNKAQLAI